VGLPVCGLALPSIKIGRLANGWPSKWGTTNERRIWSRYYMGWNTRSWKSALVGLKSFLLNPVDGRVRVWSQRNTTFQADVLSVS
jgi:hypothetical protein